MKNTPGKSAMSMVDWSSSCDGRDYGWWDDRRRKGNCNFLTFQTVLIQQEQQENFPSETEYVVKWS